MAAETSAGIDSDLFASYFSDWDPNTPPKVLITTSPKAAKATKGRRFEMGRIAGWAADRGYQKMLVANEDVKKPSE
ncbi:hypothetical protein BDM02DRAFT_3191471 [Thelephora ganbajun]|uniref:Uncharacterized protein n=1 Tax=Thelephora ganbajun TaxID=370292 RepID=A0ACB6Z213_THEGA|nr:hypothetical protein BDM02DRAFT_3191471 [Thelephora ganbajun]